MKVAAIGAVAWLMAGSAAFAEVQLTIQDGRVTLIAKDATVRQILTEWARVGQTKIVNVERIPGGPMTLELSNVPEQEALDVLLRSISGYMAAPRPAAAANLSRFDRIVVMPTSAPPRAPVSAAASAVADVRAAAAAAAVRSAAASRHNLRTRKPMTTSRRLPFRCRIRADRCSTRSPRSRRL